MKIGARIIKTGIAVSLTMFICNSLQLEPAFFGAVSAVINLQPSIFLTVKMAQDQILVHVIAVGSAITCGYLLGANAISMGLITIVVIAVYKRLNFQSGVATGVVAAVFILGSNPDEFLMHAMNRTGVIFVGLGAAMLINTTLWPPQYGQRLKEKLRESNMAAVQYFCRALSTYVELGTEKPSLDDLRKDEVERLNREVREIADFFRSERELFAYSSAQGEWFGVAKKIIDYNESLVEKADRIYSLVPLRMERRSQMGNPIVTQEFRAILQILHSGCDSVNRVNDKIMAVMLDGATVVAEEVNEAYWEKLNKALEQWQPYNTGSYYLHALIEVAVMANEIKWAARHGKKILREAIERAGNNEQSENQA